QPVQPAELGNRHPGKPDDAVPAAHYGADSHDAVRVPGDVLELPRRTLRTRRFNPAFDKAQGVPSSVKGRGVKANRIFPPRPLCPPWWDVIITRIRSEP